MELVYHMHMEMSTLLDQYEEDVYTDWCSGLDQVCQFNLDQPLISRDATSGLLSVNFNPKVMLFDAYEWSLVLHHSF